LIASCASSDSLECDEPIFATAMTLLLAMQQDDWMDTRQECDILQLSADCGMSHASLRVWNALVHLYYLY